MGTVTSTVTSRVTFIDLQTFPVIWKEAEARGQRPEARGQRHVDNLSF
jgi:hypothetical protein